MGTCSSRTVLLESSQRRKSEGHSGGEIKSFAAPHRLVRDKLRKEVQYNFPHKIKQARNSLSLIQVPSKSLQQKDV